MMMFICRCCIITALKILDEELFTVMLLLVILASVSKLLATEVACCKIAALTLAGLIKLLMVLIAETAVLLLDCTCTT